jgi:hypothetical protein
VNAQSSAECNREHSIIVSARPIEPVRRGAPFVSLGTPFSIDIARAAAGAMREPVFLTRGQMS